MRRYVREAAKSRHVRRVEPLTMAEEILIETAATTSLSICPEHPIGFDIEDRIAADKAYQLPKADDPSAGITSAHFMKLAWS